MPERPFEDYTSLRVDANAKVYAHLDEEEIQAIAKAVCELMEQREYESRMKVIFKGAS